MKSPCPSLLHWVTEAWKLLRELQTQGVQHPDLDRLLSVPGVIVSKSQTLGVSEVSSEAIPAFSPPLAVITAAEWQTMKDEMAWAKCQIMRLGQGLGPVNDPPGKLPRMEELLSH